MRRNLRTWIMGAVTLTLLLGSSAPATAGPMGRDVGAGIILGEPSGLTAKFWLDQTHAFDIDLSFDFSDEAFAVFGDYLFHFDVLNLRSSTLELPFYAGFGGKLGIRDNDRNDPFRPRDDDDDVLLGIRIPLGLTLLFKQVPLETFIEVGPGLRLLPGTDGDIDGGIGIRYYF